MAEFLLKRGANPNKQDKNGNAPLHLAAISRRMDFVDLLIAAGADPTGFLFCFILFIYLFI